VVDRCEAPLIGADRLKVGLFGHCPPVRLGDRDCRRRIARTRTGSRKVFLPTARSACAETTPLARLAGEVEIEGFADVPIAGLARVDPGMARASSSWLDGKAPRVAAGENFHLWTGARVGSAEAVEGRVDRRPKGVLENVVMVRAKKICPPKRRYS
jgi:hypothetical protein